MSIRNGLLALLADQPMYGAQLRSEFEARTGDTWPLNVGQVYQTLTRLERDGLVDQRGEDEEGRTTYGLTDAGRAEVERWWSEPVDRESTPRNELAIKLALAVTVPGVDVTRVVQAQRTATMRQLRDLTRIKSATVTDGDRTQLAWLLVVENLIFAAESEVRWLDHVEARVARAAGSASPRAATAGSPEPATQRQAPVRTARGLR
ncbi:PadR family transcriptional regulator [Arsenicicoccus piscis]|uniref:Transcriptional regulator n=1 Tax=Arsenicicoccus piscis TaxID=673954 RepID=A0ABQ6HQB3_9MICO|nr:PadR family transcriptional regulator [Arsenicicoccus piscis]MCH8629179.1 PadR family transcriptional regulator [Arsenicicoccus piscis]GMA20253.1 transcriptional regulator [Arsenicicoccus piscis]